jgi:hypothetical protein
MEFDRNANKGNAGVSQDCRDFRGWGEDAAAALFCVTRDFGAGTGKDFF